MRLSLVPALLASVLCSWNTGKPGLFSKPSPHEAYERKLTDAGLQSTAPGAAWLSAAERALTQPIDVVLPYRMTGYFAAENPRALGLRFAVTRGEKIRFRLEKTSHFFSVVCRPLEAR